MIDGIGYLGGDPRRRQRGADFESRYGWQGVFVALAGVTALSAVGFRGVCTRCADERPRSNNQRSERQRMSLADEVFATLRAARVGRLLR